MNNKIKVEKHIKIDDPRMTQKSDGISVSLYPPGKDSKPPILPINEDDK